MKFRYPVDIIGKHALLPVPFGTCHLQCVIKTQAEKFKFPRISEGPCRTVLRNHSVVG